MTDRVVNKRIGRTTRAQYIKILDILEQHQHERHNFTSSKSGFIWEEVAEACNTEKPRRDANGWRKTFSDWKYLTKRKLLDPNQVHLINNEDKRLNQLVGIVPIDGAEGVSVGTRRKQKVEEDVDMDDEWPVDALDSSAQKSLNSNPSKRIKMEDSEEEESDEDLFYPDYGNKPDWNRLYQILEERNRIERAKLAIRKNKYLLLKKVFLSKDEDDPLSEQK